MPALYLALTIEGMFAEMGHGLAHVFEPLTVCTYAVDVSDLVDLTIDDLRSSHGIIGPDLACAWEYDLSKASRQASWSVHDRLAADGAAGIIVPSFARGARETMHNLVLWRWGSELPHRVRAHDPSGRLPKDRRSWR